MGEPALSEWREPYETVLDLWDQGRLEESAALIEQGRREYPAAPALAPAAAVQILLYEDAGRRLPAGARHLLRVARRRAPGDAELLRLSKELGIRFPSLDGETLSFTVRRAPRPGG